MTIDNVSAGRQATDYLLDLGHRRIGSITGPLHVTTGRGRLEGMPTAMEARGLAPEPRHVRSGEFREEVAYSVGAQPAVSAGPADRALCRQRRDGARRDAGARRLGLRCPADISIASTDTIPGIGGLRPRLTRTEHPAST